MQLLPELARQRLESRFAGAQSLTAMHEELYRLLLLLLPEDWCCHSVLESCLPGKPPLRIQILQRFVYTDEIAMSYGLDNEVADQLVVRLYHDAKVAELHHCNALGYYLRRLGPSISPELHAGNRHSNAVFLLKWLDFLLAAGYQYRPWCSLAADSF